jgi:hypothetical protein
MKYCNLWKGVFKTKWSKEPLMSLIVLDTLDALKQVSLCMIELEKSWSRRQYVSYGATWGIRDLLDRTKYCMKFKLLYNYSERNMIWCSILCERLRFSQRITWKVLFDVVHHIERQKKEWPITWNEGGPIQKKAFVRKASFGAMVPRRGILKLSYHIAWVSIYSVISGSHAIEPK